MAAITTPLRPSRPDPAQWRKAIGGRLRDVRLDAGLRLVDVARAAGVSPQYLSEVERGRKEPSSEVLGAVTTALGMTLVDLAGALARDLARRDDRGLHPSPRPSASWEVRSSRVSLSSAGSSHPPAPATRWGAGDLALRTGSVAA
ncbi:helix-turn-helix domain-containing protein [uncultured Cellulomonas sp.]|uniref:helix-turn-helix domain-containing protein n=1 Tax=uncultured Cellulomonas sp. TaxID=189682 RepID=UPI002610BA92|nr:helix-turn-helix transcriptional regulator [uncultured Cellulomonas sp.]